MLKKLASMAAALSAAMALSGCQTAMYKPIVCDPGTALKDGRCQKVPPITNRTVLDAPKKKVASKKPVAEGPGPVQPPRRQQNVYGQPI